MHLYRSVIVYNMVAVLFPSLSTYESDTCFTVRTEFLCIIRPLSLSVPLADRIVRLMYRPVCSVWIFAVCSLIKATIFQQVSRFTYALLIMGTKRCCDQSVRVSVCLSVCLSRFLILSRSRDGDMRASPFHTHSIEGSTVGYARFKILSAGILFRRAIVVVVVHWRSMFGRGAFSVAGPAAWNSLPDYIFGIRHVLFTVFVLIRKKIFSRYTSIHSALEALRIAIMRFINLLVKLTLT